MALDDDYKCLIGLRQALLRKPKAILLRAETFFSFSPLFLLTGEHPLPFYKSNIKDKVIIR